MVRSPTRTWHLLAPLSALPFLLFNVTAGTPAARAGTATLDPDFGNGGVVVTNISGNDSVGALVALPGGGIVAAGTDGSANALARYTDGGQLDGAFVDPDDFSNVAGIVVGEQGGANALVRLDNGDLVTAGLGAASRLALARFAADGPEQDSASLISSGGFSLGQARGLVAVPGGYVTAGEGNANNCVVTKLTSGLDLAATAPQLALGPLACKGLVRDPGTGLLYTTATRDSGGSSGFGIARLDADAKLDTTFASGGVSLVPDGDTSEIPLALVRQPDGKLVVVGRAGSPAVAVVVRFNADGTLDSSFGPLRNGATGFGDGTRTFAFSASAVVLQSDGRIIVGATATGPSNVRDGAGPGAFVLARFTADGQYDVAFGDDPTGTLTVTPFGSGVTAELNAMAIQPDGKLVVGGKAGKLQSDFALARYIVSGASVTPPPDGGGGGGGGGGVCATSATESFRCLCSAGLAVPSCAGQTLATGVGKNFLNSCQHFEKALSGPAKKKRRFLSRAFTSLKRATTALRKQKKQKKLTGTCPDDAEGLLSNGRSLVSNVKAGG